MPIETTTEPPATSPATRLSPISTDAAGFVRDYRIGYRSRQASLLGRREVLTGKAKFGIFGDGKEVPQLALARAFRPGDFRSGYYRDQTFMLAAELTTVENLFAQLYAHADLAADPASAGRQMNGHFATRLILPDGSWAPQCELRNIAADSSPTSSQMPRLVGLAQASRYYRAFPEIAGSFSRQGNEIAFGTIGDSAAAEGLFWEAINAAGVLGVPMLLSIWDDGYGISVPNRLQITKADLSRVLAGFDPAAGETSGVRVLAAQGWDYPALCALYRQVSDQMRQDHVPAVIHVKELTQPQGHSTSGSHERYKSPERLAWEAEHDCLTRMRQWLLEIDASSEAELERLESEERQLVKEAQLAAWRAYRQPIDEELRTLVSLTSDLAKVASQREQVEAASAALLRRPTALRRDLLAAAEEALLAVWQEPSPQRQRLSDWKRQQEQLNTQRYGSWLYDETPSSALAVAGVPVDYAADAPLVNGFEILNACFDAMLARDPRVLAFGEDVGALGDVNQGFAGLQARYGAERVSDTGIREATILGQAIGLALRGLRPIAEIQYLDYILFALQGLADDLATLSYRTCGGQRAPVIVRTRGHRLEGIWHSGSPMAGILNLVRGMHVCVPRDMTRAAGFYNTLLAGEEPALVIEVLNGYRAKERLPSNLTDYRLALGVPEVLRPGRDVTLVTYGACCRIAAEACDLLAKVGIEVELIDVQTLLPFDREGRIVQSLERTNRILFVDEDVPGGASAFMLQQVIEDQGGYAWLDSEPRTLPATDHRPAYGSDGDYFSKPNRELIFEAVYELIHEAAPRRFPLFYR